ncbi:MAG TPA: hypothetical protein VGF55_34180 [Gemmataceae bacterium]|jgi:hypothetical protein
MDKAELVEAWRAMVAGVGGAWVLFEDGTCVTLADPAARATAVLRRPSGR